MKLPSDLLGRIGRTNCEQAMARKPSTASVHEPNADEEASGYQEKSGG